MRLYGIYHLSLIHICKSDLCVAMTVIDYEDTLKLPLDRKNLFFVDSVDREGFSSFFMECFQKYERMYEQKYERQ